MRRQVFAKFLDGDNFPQNNNVNPWGVRPPGPGQAADSAYEFSSSLYFISKKANETKESVEYELTSSLDVENVTIPNRTILGGYCSWCYRGEGCYFTGPAVATELDETNFMLGPQDSYENSAALSRLNGARPKKRGGSSIIGEFDYTATISDWTIDVNYQAGDVVKTPPAAAGEGFVAGTKQVQLTANGNLSQQNDKTIWVCVLDHLSNLNNAPEKKGGQWVADQCSKSVDACRLRFRSGYTKNNTLRFGGFPATEGYDTNS
jgi:phage-related protein